MLNNASVPDRMTGYAVKCAGLLGNIVQRLGMDQPATEDIFAEYLGPRGHLLFWQQELSGTINLQHFVDIFAKTGAVTLEDISKRRHYLYRALFDAYGMGETWFTTNAQKLAPVGYAREIAALENVRLNGRAAAEWLYRHPKWGSLVPATLVAFLTTSQDAVLATSPEGGKRPWQTNEVEAWFKKRLLSIPESERWHSEDRDWEDAKNVFPGLGRQAIRELRESHVAAERRIRGTRPKSANLPR